MWPLVSAWTSLLNASVAQPQDQSLTATYMYDLPLIYHLKAGKNILNFATLHGT